MFGKERKKSQKKKLVLKKVWIFIFDFFRLFCCLWKKGFLSKILIGNIDGIDGRGRWYSTTGYVCYSWGRRTFSWMLSDGYPIFSLNHFWILSTRCIPLEGVRRLFFHMQIKILVLWVLIDQSWTLSYPLLRFHWLW